MSPRRAGLRQAATATGLGLLAALIALVVAPQTSMMGFSAAAPWAPHGVVLITGVVAYEAGLWAAGLAVLLGAWRLGYGRGRLPVVVVFATILVMEAAVAWLTGTPLAAYAWLAGIGVRLAAGVVSVWLALRLAQPRR